MTVDTEKQTGSEDHPRRKRRLPLHTDISHTHTQEEEENSPSSSRHGSRWFSSSYALQWILPIQRRKAVTSSRAGPSHLTNNDEDPHNNYLLWGNHRAYHTSTGSFNKAAIMASIFWRDYEHSRAPTLPVQMINTTIANDSVPPATSMPTTTIDHDGNNDDDSAITARVFLFHAIKFSAAWKAMRVGAVVLLLAATHWESTVSIVGLLVHGTVFGIFSTDMWFRQRIGLRADPLHMVMKLFMVTYLVEALSRWLLVPLFLRSSTTPMTRFCWTSMAKPVAILFASDKARRAALALMRVAHIVIRVLVLEVLLILAFATSASFLFAKSSSDSSYAFGSLSQAWLSLFQSSAIFLVHMLLSIQVSTTVVNPSLWMPLYEESKASALFFVLFLIVTTLYLHSLVLSVVFQTYIQASKEVDALSREHREEALRLSFAVLHGRDGKVTNHMVQSAVQNLRPHYADAKINALMDIYTQQNCLLEAQHFPEFRQRIQDVINASIRSAPTRTIFSKTVEGLTTFIAVSNVVFVFLFSASWGSSAFVFGTTTRLLVGYTLTILGLIDLMIRVDLFQWFKFIPLTKVKPFFDGIAAFAVFVSLLGVCYPLYREEFLMVGRSMDVIRMMRFQRIFRDVVRRSGDILPALLGPLSLLVVVNHLFVCSGMALWGGAIDVGSYENMITSRYDLNNFNSYLEGVVTMFNVLIVNDWHEIAEVFTYASRHSEGYIVYPYFVAANLVNVSILLNCVTAFFVGAFTAKIEEEKQVVNEDMFLLGPKPTQLTNQTSYAHFDSPKTAELKVYERPTYDKIMHTITGGDAENDVTEHARQICHDVGIFESLLPPSAHEVGFLVFSDTFLSQCGSCGFYSLVERFIGMKEIHNVLHGLHSQLVRDTVAGSRKPLCVSKSFEDAKARQVLNITCT